MDWIKFVELVGLPIAGTAFYLLWNQLKSLKSDVHGLETELATWKLDFVRTYVTRSELEKIETKILGAIEKLDNRLERLFSKGGAND
jgi:hypothetical protein